MIFFNYYFISYTIRKAIFHTFETTISKTKITSTKTITSTITSKTITSKTNTSITNFIFKIYLPKLFFNLKMLRKTRTKKYREKTNLDILQKLDDYFLDKKETFSHMIFTS